MPPTFLINSLNDLRRRVKLLSVLFGVGILLAAAVGLILATVVVDYMLKLPVVPRLLVVLIALAAIGYLAFRWIARPVMARLSLNDVAGHLESVFPQFDDRLRSTVNFVQQSEAIPGSEVMKDRVVTEATELARGVNLRNAIVTKPVWYSVSGAVGAVGLLIALCLMLPGLAQIARNRLLGGNMPWPKSVIINAAPVPARIPFGQSLDLSLTLTKGDRPSQKATIYYQLDDGPVTREYMIRGEGGRYTARVQASGKQLKVWMASGDDETPPQVVAVVPRLAIQSVQATITPPAYSQMRPTTVDLAKAPAFMVTGSKVSLRVQFNKTLDPAKEVAFPVIANNDNTKPAAPAITVNRTDTMAPLASWVAKDSFRFRVQATDTDGFTNTGLEEYEIVVKPDQLPTVMIESPRKNVDRTPDAYLPLQVLAEDDFGIDSLRLLVDRIAVAPDPKDPNAVRPGAKKHWEIPLKNWTRIDGTGERQRFRLNWDWDLKAALGDLKPGDVLEYCVEVRDNYRIEPKDQLAGAPQAPLTHPPQFSSKLRVNIISQDEMTIRITDEIRGLAQKTKTVHDSQVSNQNETKSLQQDTKDKPALSKGDRAALEGMTSRQSAMVSQTKGLSNQLEDVQRELKENNVKNEELNSIAKEAKQDLDTAAEKPMTDAANQLNQAAQSKPNPANPQQSQQDRNQALNKSDQSQGEAAQKLEDAMQKMDKVGNLSTAIKEIQKILDKQVELKNRLKEVGKETLGKKAEELTPEQRKKLDDIAREQKDLADKMDKAVAQMNKMGDQMSKSDPQSSQAMKDAAQQAQSQQISPQQRGAAQQAQQNQQAQAQNAQQQAQIGIEVVLNTLKDAERRKLEQLAKLLDDAVKSIQDLVRRQAGHNIDNLDNQGGDAKTKALTKEELDVLYAKAQRDRKTPPKTPDVAVVTSGQESTERNTRNVAKDIEEKIQGAGAAIAQDLVRAAGKMGYAIVELRDKKLSAAYNPHQVEALNALEQALKKAEDARDEAQKKLDQRKAETIRAQLERVRVDQIEQVNKPTTDIDKARKPDGSLGRENAVRLNQLPGKEGELSKSTNELSDALRELGGIIYESAAKEVSAAMDEVKDELGKQKTGQPTQLAQTRIIEQLDAMIESLKTEKDFSKFNQKGGGGGGGGGGSKLPTEAELRLLKALQLSINKNTTQADQIPKPQQDKVALVNLGTRQGKLRTLLDGLLKATTQGKEGLKPEPDPKDKLPEEASKEQIENQETDQDLLTGDAKAEKETKQLNRVGDRMARSRQRLALDNDPGKVTQEIQKRIIIDIDDMIKQAQQQMANNQQNKPGQKGQQPKPGEQPGQQNANGQPQQNNAQQAAQNSAVSQAGKPNVDASNNVEQRNREWGAISPRLRDAVIEGATENVPVKYKKLVEDYYRGVSTGGKQP